MQTKEEQKKDVEEQIERGEWLSCLTCVNGNKETIESKCFRCIGWSKHQAT